MTYDEAVAVVGRLLAGYPGRTLEPESVDVLAYAIQPYTADCQRAVQAVWEASPQFLPSVGLVVECFRAHAAVPYVESKSIPRPVELVRQMPAEVKERWREFTDNLAAPRETEDIVAEIKALPPMKPGTFDHCTGRDLTLTDGHLVCSSGHCHDPDCTPGKHNGESMRKRWRDIEAQDAKRRSALQRGQLREFHAEQLKASLR